MKRTILTVLLLMVFTLSGCDFINDDTTKDVTGCAPGYERVDGVCEEIIVEEENCEDGEVLVEGECVVSSIDLSGADYQSQNYDEYTERDIVTDSCSHLDNIGEWQPVWCDEFNYEGLPNTNLWSYDVGGHGWGNGELQYYTDQDLDNTYVGNGVLTIKSIKENYQGKSYTSTRLISKEKGDFLYGKIQVRAKVPAGTGTWPAVWMLPTDWVYGGWPTSGEIDIMEYVGYHPNTIHATIHTEAYNHMRGTQVGKARTLTTAEEEFHVYEIEWEPNVIRYYLDGALFFTVDYDPDDSSDFLPYEAWPFDEEFHLLLNTAIGGAWGGVNGVDDSIFPVEFLIDYVRVYQKDYAGMDTENPSPVTNLRLLKNGQSESFLAWDVAADDVMVKEYEIYLDGTLLDTDSHNAYVFTGLTPDTTYEVKIVAVDFAGNKSTEAVYSLQTESPLTVNDRIEAEDFTQMSGIQTENTQDTSGDKNVGWIDTNDYLEYIIEAPTSGSFQIAARIASPAGGAFDIYVDGVKVGSCDVAATGGWQSWQTSYSSFFSLTEGSHTIKLVATSSGWNINYFEFLTQD